MQKTVSVSSELDGVRVALTVGAGVKRNSCVELLRKFAISADD